MDRRELIKLLAVVASAGSLPRAAHSQEITAMDAREIAKQAYIYAFPMVESYKTLYAQSVDSGGPNYKAPFNEIGSTAQVFTPKDTAIVTPNSDTPYSMMWMDLRTEPLVLTLPEIDPSRFYHVQLIDLYTFNFAYLGQRTTGSKGGHFMIAGPGWNGETPDNIDKVVRSETEIAYAIYRTQLFGPDDIDNVKKIQAGYKVQPLSAFTGQAAPAAAAAIEWPKPDPATMTQTPSIFRYLNFLLSFAPPHPSEKELMALFAKIGIGSGKPFDETSLAPELKEALQNGIKDGVGEFETFQKTRVDTRQVSTADMFGTREHLKNNYLYRYAAARLGIFGNSGEEAIYHGYFVDSDGAPLDAAGKRYSLTFGKGNLPPVEAFWSVTMYDGKSQFLVDNPISRYLINSPMLPQLKTDADGGLTLEIQHTSPGPDKESNWLPAPDGPFFLVLRLYRPKPEGVSGEWQAPPLKPVA